MIVRVYDDEYNLVKKVSLSKLIRHYEAPENYDEEILVALGELQREEAVEKYVDTENGLLVFKIKRTERNSIKSSTSMSSERYWIQRENREWINENVDWNVTQYQNWYSRQSFED